MALTATALDGMVGPGALAGATTVMARSVSHAVPLPQDFTCNVCGPVAAATEADKLPPLTKVVLELLSTEYPMEVIGCDEH